jgi:hypothetical protein
LTTGRASPRLVKASSGFSSLSPSEQQALQLAAFSGPGARGADNRQNRRHLSEPRASGSSSVAGSPSSTLHRKTGEPPTVANRAWLEPHAHECLREALLQAGRLAPSSPRPPQSLVRRLVALRIAGLAALLPRVAAEEGPSRVEVRDYRPPDPRVRADRRPDISGAAGKCPSRARDQDGAKSRGLLAICLLGSQRRYRRISLATCKCWRPREDSNLRPTV